MSFASDVKSELLNVKSKLCCQLAELAALLRINGDLTISSEGIRIEFHTTNIGVARHVVERVKQLYKVDVELLSKKQMKLNKHDIYIIKIIHKTNTIVHECALMDDYEDILKDPLLIKDCCKKAYLRGAFLASGSINSPRSSSYHLEIHTSDENHAIGIMNLFNHFELNAKYVVRKNGYIAYIKESERISDFLRLSGAINALFTYEDERIKRDFVNSITRVMNMDIANQNKTLEAANKQLKSISILENTLDIKTLNRSVQEAIELRKAYPESSLKELSEYSEGLFGKPISKSALNHRFRNINELADDIMEEMNYE
ncbi:MAG: DNA-binding protein WhiA [Candidatus Izimaplasma sp.]|nr:DNA-binding protein WhiA [Candidatus Izimaplasma bacterium]